MASDYDAASQLLARAGLEIHLRRLTSSWGWERTSCRSPCEYEEIDNTLVDYLTAEEGVPVTFNPTAQPWFTELMSAPDSISFARAPGAT